METKNTRAIKSKKLLIHHLLEKKSWAALTLIVLIVTVIVLPMLMETKIREEYIIIGVIEVFVVILINCLLDFNYLHDNRKFGYYMSKPLSSIKRIHMILISNTIFASIFMGLLFIISVTNGLEVKELFLIPVSWLIILMLLTTLSSLLSGNTIIAGLSTAFNFSIPLLILGVIFFAMDIVGDIAIGINVDIIMDYIFFNIYKLDVIYLVKFVQEFTLLYFFIMGGICFGIYLLMRWTLKHRKNERIGDHILFKGYKYFIALMASIMVPFIFSTMLNNNDYVTKLIAFVILGSLTYYVALVILEKSFKMKKTAVRSLIVFMILFVGMVLLAGGITKTIEKNIPEISEIEEVLIISQDYVYVGENENYKAIQDLDLEAVRKYDISTFKLDSNKELITDIHRTIVDNPNYKNYLNLNIVYFLKDGSQINRYFDLNYNNDKTNVELNDLLFKLLQTDEHKKIVCPILYDDVYRNKQFDFSLNVNGDNINMDLILTAELFEEFVTAMKKDLHESTVVGDVNYVQLGHENDQYNFSVRKDLNEVKEYDYLFIRLNYGNGKYQSYDISYNFDHTREFLKNLKE